MKNDKTITASLIDAVYKGADGLGYTKETEYRLRAVRSVGGLIKVKLHKPEGDFSTYGSESHFESNWINVRKVAVTNW